MTMKGGKKKAKKTKAKKKSVSKKKPNSKKKASLSKKQGSKQPQKSRGKSASASNLLPGELIGEVLWDRVLKELGEVLSKVVDGG